MPGQKPKIFVIVGPTASGKSDLGIELALKYNGEVVSADSRQVYKGMDIGTGKITEKEMRGVPHYLLDVVSPRVDFNVAKYKIKAQKAVKDILKRGKIPIIVGGTGFWIDAVVYGIDFPEIGPDIELRQRLEKERPSVLFNMLKKTDKERARRIDSKNKRRLIRALEIVMLSNRPVPKIIKKSKYDALWLGIKAGKKDLEEKIKARLKIRLKHGLADEVEKLHKQGVSWKRLDDFGLEYRYVSRMLRGLLNYKEMVKQLERAIIQYSKRQMTWWKKNGEIKWVRNYNEADNLVRRWKEQ